MHQRRIHSQRIDGGVGGHRIRRHAFVYEPRLALHTTAMTFRIAIPVLAALIALLGARHDRTAANIWRYATAVEATAAITHGIASLAVAHIAIETATVARRDTDPVAAVVPTVRQAAGRIVIVTVSILAHAGRLVRTEAVLAAPKG